MLVCITPEQHDDCHGHLDEMFKFRRRVMMKDRGWNFPDLGRSPYWLNQNMYGGPEYELDPFDHEHTVYFLAYRRAMNGDHTLVGSGRLNPTETPHMMADVFAERCEIMGVQRGPQIATISRCVIDNANLDAIGQLFTTLILSHAFTAYSVKNGFTQVSWFEEEFMYAKSVRFWRTQALGILKKYPDNKHYIASLIDTSRFAENRLYRALQGLTANMEQNVPNPRRLSRDQYRGEDGKQSNPRN